MEIFIKKVDESFKRIDDSTELRLKKLDEDFENKFKNNNLFFIKMAGIAGLVTVAFIIYTKITK